MKTFTITQFINNQGVCINRTIRCSSTEKVIYVGSYNIPSTTSELLTLALNIINNGNNGLGADPSPGDVLNISTSQQDNSGSWVISIQQTTSF